MLLYVSFITRDDVVHRGPYDVIVLTSDAAPVDWYDLYSITCLGLIRAYNDVPIRRRIRARWAQYRRLNGLYRLTRDQVNRLLAEFTSDDADASRIAPDDDASPEAILDAAIPLCSSVVPPHPRLQPLSSYGGPIDMLPCDADSCPSICPAVCVFGPPPIGAAAGPNEHANADVINCRYVHHPMYTARRWLDRHYPELTIDMVAEAYSEWLIELSTPPPLTYSDFERVCWRTMRLWWARRQLRSLALGQHTP